MAEQGGGCGGGKLKQRSLVCLATGYVDCLFYQGEGLGIGLQAHRPFYRVHQGISRLVGELILRPCLVGVHVVAGNNGRSLDRGFALVILGDLEVAILPLGLGYPSVGDLLDHALDELELAPLGRERVGVVAEQFLTGQLAQLRLDLLGRGPAQHGHPLDGEGLAEHRGVLDQRAVLFVEPIQAGPDQGVE